MVQYLVLDCAEFINANSPTAVTIDLNWQDRNGWTPLCGAAFAASNKSGNIDHLKICEFLLQQVKTIYSCNPAFLVLRLDLTSRFFLPGNHPSRQVHLGSQHCPALY